MTQPWNDSWVKLWTTDETFFLVDPRDETQIDNAVEGWISSGRTRDTIMHLRLVDGGSSRQLASTVTGWMLFTPEIRQQEWEHAAARIQEEKKLKSDAGIFESEEQ